MYALKECALSEPIINIQERFREQGYLFLRAFFPLALIQKVRDRVIAILQLEGWGKLKKEKLIAIKPVRRINSSSFHHCITRLMKEELLHDLSEYPPLHWFLSALLGEPVFSHPRKMVRITYPYHLNPKDRIPSHQDLFYIKGERDTFTAWVPLGEYIPEQGGLLVAPGTHKQGLFPTQSNDEGRFGCKAVEDYVTGFSWYKAHYRPRDLLVMHSLTLHQAGINESDQFRLSVDCRFSSALRSINEDQLLPPYYPHVPSWEILSQKWNKRDRFTVPLTMQIHRKERELSEVLMTPTRFAE